MELSIVILNYNSGLFLTACLDSIFQSELDVDFEVLVADNASSDQSLKWAKSNHPQIKTLPFDQNFGFAKANNLAAEQAKGKYLLFLNPDTLVGVQLCRALLEFAERQADFGAVGVRYLDGKGSFLPECKRRLPSRRAVLLKWLGCSELYYENRLKEKDKGQLQVLAGACLMVDRQRFFQVGAFDERYFMYGEDIDLCHQFLRHGRVNWYLGNLSIVHFKGESTFKDKVYFERFYGAIRLFYEKNFRHSVIETALVNAFFERLIKFKSQKKIQPLESIEPGLNCYLGKRKEIYDKLEPRIEGLIWLTQLEDLDALKGASCVFVDLATQDLDAVFDWMDRNVSKGHSYRFVLSSGDGYVGSDSPNDRGESILLD